MKIKRSHPSQHRAAAMRMVAVEIPLDASNPPFPLLRMPPLVEASAEHDGATWSLTPSNQTLAAARGYYRGLIPVPHRSQFWMLREDETIWMSVAMMELESNAQMVQAAKGRVLVGGLGMGITTWNLLQKPEVEQVVVIEKNPAVIELMTASIDAWQLERERLVLVNDDVMHRACMSSLGAFDYALIDIWPKLADDALRSDMQLIAHCVDAAHFAAWGVEMEFIAWCAEQKIAKERVWSGEPGLFPAFCDFDKVNYVGRDDPRMTKLCLQATLNQHAGRFGGIQEVWDSPFMVVKGRRH